MSPSEIIVSPGRMFDEVDYDSALAQDLSNAHARIVFVSPYVRVQRIERWLPLLRGARERGVAVCVYAREPRGWHQRLEPTLPPAMKESFAKFDAAAQLFQSVGVHIELRPDDHQKFVLIDEEIFWAGSLNVFSWYDSKEWLRRAVSREEVHYIMNEYDLASCPQCSPALTIAQSIRSRRLALGWSQQELARRSGVSRSSVRESETDAPRVFIPALLSICRTLQMSIHIIPTYADHAVTDLARKTGITNDNCLIHATFDRSRVVPRSTAD